MSTSSFSGDLNVLSLHLRSVGHSPLSTRNSQASVSSALASSGASAVNILLRGAYGRPPRMSAALVHAANPMALLHSVLSPANSDANVSAPNALLTHVNAGRAANDSGGSPQEM